MDEKEIPDFNSEVIIKSPGQLLSHYSPDSKILLNEKFPKSDDLYLGFGPYKDGIRGLNLSETENLKEADLAIEFYYSIKMFKTLESRHAHFCPQKSSLLV